MQMIKCRIRNFFKDEEGASAVEYALLLSFIVAVIAASVGSLGSHVKELFESVLVGFPS